MDTAQQAQQQRAASSWDADTAATTERAFLAEAVLWPVETIRAAEAHDIQADDFTDADRGAAFAAVRGMAATGEPVSLSTVSEKLNADGSLAALAALRSCFPADEAKVWLVEAHAANVAQRAARHRLVRFAKRLLTEAEKATANPDTLAAGAVADLASMQDAAAGRRTSAPEIVAEVVENWIAVDEGRRQQRGVPLPTPGMNGALGWLEPGLHVLGAATSAGKSTVESAVARHLALNGRRVLRCFLDMEAPSLLARDLAALCFVELDRMGTGRNTMRPEEKDALRLASWAWPRIEVLDAANVEEIVARARTIKADRGLDLVTVDYVQLVDTGDRKLDGGANSNAQVQAVTKRLRKAAQALGVPFLLLSQLNRKNEDGAAPTLADLRDSGAIGHDARSVSFLHPPKIVLDRPTVGSVEAWRGMDLRPVWLTVAKNQQGRLGSAPLRMLGSAFSIEDAAHNPAGPDWDEAAAPLHGYPAPVIARDTLGRYMAFDPRFLDLLNEAAAERGAPSWKPVDEVREGLAKVRERLAEWRNEEGDR